MSEEKEFFVYLYRDQDGNPAYIGQGRHPLRAVSHRKNTHNTAFKKWLSAQKGQPKIEIIGPLGSKVMADAIESSIISACLPATALTIFNISPGRSKYQFRPFGVPEKYVERTTQFLTLSELKNLAKSEGDLMFVRINQKDFDDGPGRVGYDLANPPEDTQLRARIESWWQIARRLAEWTQDWKASPALLIAVTGAPGVQSVVASAKIDRANWADAEVIANGLAKIPIRGSTLEASHLRGRPKSLEVGLKFGSWRHQQFRIFTPHVFRSGA